MATQGQRQNFMWRPNTNDSTTLTRYDQEAAHWVRAVTNASRPKGSLAGTLGVIGLILDTATLLVWMLFTGIATAAVWLFGSKSGGVVNKRKHKRYSDKELDTMFEDAEELDIYA
jgi:hypothetical protein